MTSFANEVQFFIAYLESGEWDVIKFNFLVEHTHSSVEPLFDIVFGVLHSHFDLMEERGSELTTSSSIVGTLVIIVHQSEPHVSLRVTSLLAEANFVQTIIVISVLHYQSFEVNFRSSESILSNHHIRSNEKFFIRLLVAERVLPLVLLPLHELDFFNAVEADNLGDVLIHEDADTLFLHHCVNSFDHFGTKALADF